VNWSLSSSLAALRMRSSACDTLARPCVRCVRCRPAFPPERSWGPPPFLHRLRHRWRGFVRRLPRYYGAVRLLPSVHHRLRPSRPSRHGPLPRRDGQTRDLPVSVQRVSIRAWGLRPRKAGSDARLGAPAHVAFPIVPQGRRFGCIFFRGSIPSPHVPLSTLRAHPRGYDTHDSGPVWMASPSPYGSFIRNSSPASRRSGQYTIYSCSQWAFPKISKDSTTNSILSPISDPRYPLSPISVPDIAHEFSHQIQNIIRSSF